MLKSEMQHQFWVTKKAVQRRFGSKEDECIVSSDAELDAKIELFKSIAESCGHLYRIIDNYQERVCIVAQEENALGKFLKETGKNSNTTGKIMSTTGKALSYCGQQRMIIRPPLLRLHHEVETFRGRAISDTQVTILAMERERTKYRAALSWMKSSSNQLDPDTGKGLEKFRKAQNHVRLAKSKFDRLSLDCLQKIDLLAAARCNMFSHALVAYMHALLQLITKSTETFKATAKALDSGAQYNFCILKDLSDNPQQCVLDKNDESHGVQPVDSDQMLFFLDDYKDDEKFCNTNSQGEPIEKPQSLIDISSITDNISMAQGIDNIKHKMEIQTTFQKDELFAEDLLGLASNDYDNNLQTEPSYMPSSLLLMQSRDDFLTKEEQTSQESSNKQKNTIFDFFNIIPKNLDTVECDKKDSPSLKTDNKKNKSSRKDMSAWFQLFSELDPLSNPDAIARKIDGGKENSQAA